ncbi:MAG TPA: RNA-binding protein [Lachnospiraceae bacterium]|nr:RNA-binding protein [Lachnospiraceae bacterium]
MSEMIRVSGKTLQDAITNATIRLGVTSDNIIYTVIEHESRGFLGIGQKDAVIEVRAKDDADFEAERLKKKAEEDARKAAVEAQEAAKREAEEAARKAREDAARMAAKEEVKREVKKETRVEGAIESEDQAAASQEEEAKDAGTESGSDSQDRNISPRKREREIKPLENPQEAIDKAEGFLRDVYGAMGMDVELVSNYDGEVLNVQMNGDDMGILIGKRGQTLDSLQYLVSLVVNKGSSTYVRVKLDTENYRERRKATLENLAKNISVKVRKTRRSVSLEPMNPYERRIIHSALQNDPFVTTHSEGEEPDRKVVVTLRADADLDALDRKYGEKHYRGGGRGGYRGGGRRGNRRGYRKHEENNYRDHSEQMEPVRIPDTGSADSSGE